MIIHQIEMPKTDKDGLLNQIKMIHNKVERLRAVQGSGESLAEISLLFAALIDDLSPERVQFQWESAAERERRCPLSSRCKIHQWLTDP